MDKDIVSKGGEQTICVKELKEKVDLTKYIEEYKFNFDRVFDETTDNETLYIETVQPLVAAAFQGCKITCFAYGQTGSGKTHTMMGPSMEVPGIYLLAAHDIFTLLEDGQMGGLTLHISFYEIYCGKLFDLLNGRAAIHA